MSEESKTKHVTIDDIEYVAGPDGKPLVGVNGKPVISKKQAQKNADEKRRAARKDGFNKILAFVAAQIANDASLLTADLKAALDAMRPLRSTTPTVRETMQDKLGRLFSGKTAVTGYEVYQFEGTHWGTSDMKRNMVLVIKTGKPEDRMWITYDGKADVYTLVARGAQAPAGWLGYCPVDVAV